MRPGVGPVFTYEWLTTTRRWQVYAQRAGFVGLLLIAMMIVWRNTHRFDNPGQTVSLQQLASYGENLYMTVVSIELTLVLLAAPAATAGAVCLDKARGTLDHMLATDLSNAEIVLGKLGTRLVPVLGLIACVVPITALASLLGGIDPNALLGSFLTVIGCALVGCSLALTLSVWGRKTHEVLMLTYLIMVLWLIAPFLLALAAIFLMSLFLPQSAPPPPFTKILWEWIVCTNPYYLAFAPYADPGKIGWATFVGFLAICLAASGLLVGLATLRIRGVALKQAGQSAARSRRGRFALPFPRPAWLPHLPGPSLDGNPVLWREWHRSKPTGLLRVVSFLYAALGILWVGLSLHLVTAQPGFDYNIAFMSTFQILLGLLLLSVSAATSLAEERVRGSLDVLLTTPLSTRSILAGKWLGTFRQSARVLVWPAIMAGLLVAASGRFIHYLLLLGLILAYCATITSLGLALATWVSRLGRAVALCVSAYIVFSIGWVIFVALLSGPNQMGAALMLGSPLYGTLLATIAVASHGVPLPEYQGGISTFVWILIHNGIAGLLFAATAATFDDCLGRVSETEDFPMPKPRKKPIPEVDLDY